MPVSHSASAHRPTMLLDPLGPRIGGEVEVGAQPTEQRVADAAADQIQLVSGVGKQSAEVAENVGVPIQRDRGGGQQLGIGMGVVRHVVIFRSSLTLRSQHRNDSA